MTFEEWLEEEHPCHSVYDHECAGDYEHWKSQLKKAYEAGRKSVEQEHDGMAVYE